MKLDKKGLAHLEERAAQGQSLSRAEMLALFDAARAGVEAPEPDALARELARALNLVAQEVRAWCDAVERDSSWDGWDSHYKGFKYDRHSGAGRAPLPSKLDVVAQVLAKARAADLVGLGATEPVAEALPPVTSVDDLVRSLGVVLKPFYEDCRNDHAEVEATAQKTLVEVARAVQKVLPQVDGWEFLASCGLLDSDIVDLVDANGMILDPEPYSSEPAP